MRLLRQLPTRHSALLLLLSLAFLLHGVAALAAEEAEETPVADPIPVTEILSAGPVTLALPAFHDEDKAGVKADDLFQALPGLPQKQWPRSGDQFSDQDGTITWKMAKAVRPMDKPDAETAARYAAFYVTTDRWQKATLTVTGDHPVAAVLDGAAISLSKEEVKEGEVAIQTGEVTLTIGKHLVCLRTMYDEEAEADWSWELSVTPDVEAGPESLAFSTDPAHNADIQLILHAPRINHVGLSPDGKLAAVGMSEYRNGSDRETWIEIRDTKNGDLVHLWRGADNPSRLGWLPTGRTLSWQTSKDDKTTVWVHDLSEGSAHAVLEDIEDLGSWQWAPDGKSLFYEISRSPEADPRKVKRVAHPADRQSWWRDRTHLMQVFLPGGLTRRLTAGPLSPEGWVVSPDGKQLLFFTNVPDMQARPYNITTMWMMDLETLAVEKVMEDPWVAGAQFSPDQKTLLIQGSPSAFDGLGRNLPESMQANDYGGQLYLWDLAKKSATPISKDLVPDASWVEWSPADGMIYARTTDTQYRNFYRYDPKKKTWKKLDTGMEFTNELALPKSGNTAVVRGTSSTTPNRLYALDLKKNRPRLILDPGTDAYRDITLGKVENWATKLENGMELDGFVYYPPGFDKSKKYPLIVYYYGGTSPVTRDFGGRYPKNVWAGQGYLVYVPEPSGATGYGQEFAARHVNDWGILTAGEVIEGTKAFLAAHPYADGEKVGCMGASYGGFLTQYVITQTDLFAAAISHAGISDISSYWGEGLWGYAYGARALAHSFPWKDRELFIEQSPLFHADKITTPLLLVHGDSDTNVPKGESDQLFTALKMLDREVEYVQIQGQDHWIQDHGQRIVWNDTILAFWAKYLKGQPQWWSELYPESKDY
jgi:dipeptidyl aminopeptidase/acylaminoacyl peptidase